MTQFNVKALYLYKFMSECKPIFAFNVILFIQRGMSATDVAILIALWSVFAMIFEIPGGILADRWNRRNMIAIGEALHGICFIIWFFSNSFIMFAAGYAFWAMASAGSGTEQGLIYDNLKSDGREEDFAKVYGKAHFYGTIGVVAGISSAGAIAIFISIEAIALISAAICFINIILALRIREVNFYSKRLKKETTGFFSTFKEARIFIKGNKTVIASILFLVLFASLGGYLDEFDALIINDFRLGEIWVSAILVIRFAFVAVGDILAPVVQKKISAFKHIFLLNVLACLFLAFFALIWSQYALLIFGLAFMVMAITEILISNALQKEIKEEGRSTVMIFCGVGQNAAQVCLSLAFALLAGIFTLQQVYIIISIYGIVGGLGFYLFFKIIKITTQ